LRRAPERRRIVPAVVFFPGLCHNAGLPPPGRKGCRGDGKVLNQHAQSSSIRLAGRLPMAIAAKESQMPKIKTKSGAKKRFKITGTGKVLYAHRGKRHGMIKRTNKQIRQLRGTDVLFKTDGDNIKKYFLPNG
jgi:large subunit ribosomal protein L35